MCYLVRNASEIPAGMLQVKWVSKYWELTLWNGDVLEVVTDGIHRRKAACATRTCLVPWEWRPRGKRGHNWLFATDLGMGLWTGVGGEEESEDLKICFPEGYGCWLPRECVRQMEPDMAVKKAVGEDPWEMGVGEGRVQQVVCTELGKTLGD